MANFPASLDTLTNPTPTDYLNSPSHAGQHANANDSIEALEAKVGINSSAVTTSHDYKLSAITGSEKACSLQQVYPVGSVYINYSNNTNPGTLLGFGTWVATAVGRAIVGIDAGQAEFDTAGETGGAKTHTLTATEMPAHNHNEKFRTPDGSTGAWAIQYNSNGGIILTTENAGGGGAHNNLQPYQVFYIWRRTV